MLLPIEVVVDQPPLLQEAMDPQDGSNITSKVTSTSCYREVLGGVETKTVHHEITICHVAREREKGRERERERERVHRYNTDF